MPLGSLAVCMFEIIEMEINTSSFLVFLYEISCASYNVSFMASIASRVEDNSLHSLQLFKERVSFHIPFMLSFV